MRKNSLLKKLALGISLLLCATTMSAAKTYFASANGNWDNDGLSSSTAWPLEQALIDEAMSNGDKLVIVGNIVLDNTIEIINKSITITGYNALNAPDEENRASSLDGGSAGRIFDISGEGEVIIANLVLKNATNKAIQIDGSEGPLAVNIGYCLFKENSSNRPSSDGPDNGAGVTVVGGAIANIFSCWFHNNQAFRGGALFVDGSFVDVQYTNFEGNFTNANVNEANARGGAVACAGAYTLEFNYCIFKGNYSRRGGGCIFEYGQGEFTVKNSVLTDNHSGHDWFLEIVLNDDGEDIGVHVAPGDNHGGLMKTDGGSVITFINTTIYKNNAYDDAIGGAFIISGGEFTMINCTVTENMTNGNQFHTGGLFIENNANVKIYNSIIDRNKAAGGSFWSDFAGNSESATYEIKNSIIGAYRNAVTADMDDISRPKYGNTNTESQDDYNFNTPPGDTFNAANLGIFFLNSVPLLPNAINTTKVGDFSYLANLGIETDQIGNTIVPENGKIFAGALQFAGTQDEAENHIKYVLPDEKPCSLYAAYSDSKCTGNDIYNPFADNNDAVIVAYYTILGQKLDKEPASGMFIIKYSNGKSVKVVKK